MPDTKVRTTPTKQSLKRSEEPRQSVLDRIAKGRRTDRLKNLLIFCLFITSTVLPFLLFLAMSKAINKPQKVAIIDPAGNLYVSPLRDEDASQELRDYCAQAAGNALLSRNPKGLDYKDVAESILSGSAQRKLVAEVEEYRKSASRNDLRWKVEFDKLQAQPSLDNESFLYAITGYVIETGKFANVFEQRPRKFALGLKLMRNGDLLSVGRFPYVVAEYKLQFE